MSEYTTEYVAETPFEAVSEVARALRAIKENLKEALL